MWMDCGDQYVTPHGMSRILQFYADSSNIMGVSWLKSFKVTSLTHYCYIPASYPLHGYSRTNNHRRDFHIGKVECSGSEAGLSECSYQRVSSCIRKRGRAGVICTSNSTSVSDTLNPLYQQQM